VKLNKFGSGDPKSKEESIMSDCIEAIAEGLIGKPLNAFGYVQSMGFEGEPDRKQCVTLGFAGGHMLVISLGSGEIMLLSSVQIEDATPAPAPAPAPKPLVPPKSKNGNHTIQ
jgi:hypothetical protein